MVAVSHFVCRLQTATILFVFGIRLEAQICNQPNPVDLGCWTSSRPLQITAPGAGEPAGRMQAVHAIALHDRRVLCIDWLHFFGETPPVPNVVLFDPTVEPNDPTCIRWAEVGAIPFLNLFCAGHTALADGRIFF